MYKVAFILQDSTLIKSTYSTVCLASKVIYSCFFDAFDIVIKLIHL